LHEHRAQVVIAVATLQVRDLPQDLYEGLSLAAKSQHRSLAQQTAHIIQLYLQGAPEGVDGTGRRVPAWMDWVEEDPAVVAQRRERRRGAFAEADALGPVNVPEGFPSAEELVRADRDAR
jgi:hypothetical protein